jgi:hypothetical protein
MFIVVGVLGAGTAAWVLSTYRDRFRLNKTTALSFAALNIWALGTFFCTHNNVRILAVWLLATYLPLFFLVISSYFFSSDSEAPKWMYHSCTFWVIIMAVVGFAEIWLGLSHPINKLPQEAGIGSIELRKGIGDYTVANGSGDSSYSGIAGLFRPTSIFLSNGKFGQALFVLVLYRWIYLFRSRERMAVGTMITLVFDLLALLISGQRSALVLLSICAASGVLYGVAKRQRRAVYILSGVIVAGLVGLSAMLVINPGVAELVADRYISGFTDISERISDNLIAPSATIVGLYGLLGNGPGFFSLGAQKFGGAMMWQVLTLNGNAEGVWMRVVAEIGVVGLILYVLYHGGLVIQALKRSVTEAGVEASPCIFAFVWLLGVAAWGITHDTFANAFGMSIGFGLCGAAFHPAVSRNWKTRVTDRTFSFRRQSHLTRTRVQ